MVRISFSVFTYCKKVVDNILSVKFPCEEIEQNKRFNYLIILCHHLGFENFGLGTNGCCIGYCYELLKSFFHGFTNLGPDLPTVCVRSLASLLFFPGADYLSKRRKPVNHSKRLVFVIGLNKALCLVEFEMRQDSLAIQIGPFLLRHLVRYCLLKPRKRCFLLCQLMLEGLLMPLI